MSAPLLLRVERSRLPAIVGAGALLLWAIACVIDLRGALGGWLAAFVFWLALALGALTLRMTHVLTGGSWGIVLASPLRRLARLLPVAALGCIPLLAGVAVLYPWAQGAAPAANAWYLSTGFFVVRGVAYAIIWIALALVFERAAPDALVGPASAGLALVALTLTFAATDWISSLDPRFNSSVFGLRCGLSFLTAAFAAALLVGRPATTASAESNVVLGNLLLAGTLLWAYLALMQFVIIWEENLPDEIGWYLRRFEGFWGVAAVAITLLRFVLPALLLLPHRMRASERGLTLVAGLVLAGHLLDAIWLVIPEAGSAAAPLGLVAALVAMGALGLAAAPAIDRVFAQVAGSGPRAGSIANV